MIKNRIDFTFAAIVAGCVVLTANVQARAEFEYEFIIIEPWNTSYSLATSSVDGLNNNNQVTGCASPVSGGCSFIWTHATGKVPINVAGPINDTGVIIISNYIRWPDGTLQELDGAMSGAADINNANVVAGSDGSVHTCPLPPPFVNREATIWTASGGTILVHQQLGVTSADQAWAINDNNVFVGVKSSTGHCGDQKAFYYDLDANQYVDLHFLVTGMSSGITHAFDINNSNVVVGDGPLGAFMWSAATGVTHLPEIPGTLPTYSKPTSINNAGRIAGQAIVNDEWRAWVWDAATGIRDLNTLAEGIPPNFVIDGAKKINDNGWIIGSGHYGTWSPERAVVLIPIPASLPGDIDGDGDVDFSDRDLFVAILLGEVGDPQLVERCDINGDGLNDGEDVGPFIAAILGG